MSSHIIISYVINLEKMNLVHTRNIYKRGKHEIVGFRYSMPSDTQHHRKI